MPEAIRHIASEAQLKRHPFCEPFPAVPPPLQGEATSPSFVLRADVCTPQRRARTRGPHPPSLLEGRGRDRFVHLSASRDLPGAGHTALAQQARSGRLTRGSLDPGEHESQPCVIHLLLCSRRRVPWSCRLRCVSVSPLRRIFFLGLLFPLPPTSLVLLSRQSWIF